MNLKTAFFILFAILLIGCSAQSAAPTATATIHPSPTLTPLPSATPSPTLTPTPSVIPIPGLSPEANNILNNLGPTFTMEQVTGEAERQFMDFDVLNSEPFAEAMVYAVNHGMLPVPGPEAVPFDHIVLSDPSKFDGSGVGYMFTIPYDKGEEMLYYDVSKRPWMPALVYDTKVGETESQVLFLVYENKDKTYGVLGELTVVSDRITKNLKDADKGFGLHRSYIPAGIRFTTDESCEKYYAWADDLKDQNLRNVCSWAMGVMKDEEITAVLSNWANSNIGSLNNVAIGNDGEKKFRVPILRTGVKMVGSK